MAHPLLGVFFNGDFLQAQERTLWVLARLMIVLGPYVVALSSLLQRRLKLSICVHVASRDGLNRVDRRLAATADIIQRIHIFGCRTSTMLTDRW